MEKKTNQKLNVFEAIVAVRSRVGVVHKNGKNTFHKYNYATANDVLHEVREALNEIELAIIPSQISDISFGKNGDLQHFTQHYTLVGPDGSNTTAQIRCSGEDKGDKSAYKANTGALKYLMIQLFLLPTDQDPENDSKHLSQSNVQTVKAAFVSAPQADEASVSKAVSEPIGRLGQATQMAAEADSGSDDQERPWLSEEQFVAMLKTIEEGKKDLVRKRMENYRIRLDYRQKLKTALIV